MYRWLQKVVSGTVVTVLAAAFAGATVSADVAVQEVAAEDMLPELDVQIEARRLTDGRVEYALRLLDAPNRGADRIVSPSRFLPVRESTGRWLSSTPIQLRFAPIGSDDPTARVWARITARRLTDGRIEFGLQYRRSGGRWEDRLLPVRRFFPTSATIGRWLASSPLEVTTPRFGGFTAGGGARSGETLIAASFRRTCAVQPDGGVTCWGEEGTRERLSAAVLEDVLTVSLGDNVGGRFHTCALHGDGSVSCWGPGKDGELGQGDKTDRHIPVKVPGIGDAVAIAAGSSHTCAVHRRGRVSCWGDNSWGQLGHESENASLSPRVLPGVERVRTIAAGGKTTCVVHTDGGVSCWGWGVRTESGDPSPRAVGGLDEAISVAVGWSDACAVRADGQVYCWSMSRTMRPVPVPGVRNAVAVAIGDESFCALHRDGGVSCWGENNEAGQLGTGTTDGHADPVRLAGITDAVAVTVTTPSIMGEGHACAMRADGSVLCWGTNGFGQLGDGTFEPRLVPTAVQAFRSFSADDVSTDPTRFLRTWIDRVVEEEEDEFPWLRLAWDHARNRTFLVDSLDREGYASHVCDGRGVLQTCTSDRVVVRTLRLSTVIHELAHVYDHTLQLVSPREWGAVQLYFAVTYPDCYTDEGFGAGVELLAGTMEHLVVPYAWLAYYNPPVEIEESPFDSPDCPGLAGQPTDEAEAVVLAGLAGEVPDWYTENITSGAELWAAIRSAPSVRLLLNLQDEFGGLCPLGWFGYPLDIDDWPSADDNQFRDGGC